MLAPDVLGLPLTLESFDLSLTHRRATNNDVVREAAAAMRASGLGLKAATITPPGRDDVGSPNRLLREGINGSVIHRTGRPIPGVVAPTVPAHPITVARLAVGDAYGAAEGREDIGGDEVAWRTERISRHRCRIVAEYAFSTAARTGAEVYGGPKWTVSPTYEGVLKEEMDEAARRHPAVPYRPTLVDATYAGLLTERFTRPVVIPALNRDGDCLSDLVLALYGTIAGAESMLLALDDYLRPTVAMAEAPHGTAPSLEGLNRANPMAMLLACAAILEFAGSRGDARYGAAGHRLRAATLQAAADGVRTADIGGDATTNEVVDEVIRTLGAARVASPAVLR